MTLCCYCSTANCKEKIIPIIFQKRERDRKKILTGKTFFEAFSIFNFLFMSKWYQRTFLTCSRFYYVVLSLFFSNYGHHQCEWMSNSLATINIVCVWVFCNLHPKKKKRTKKGNIKKQNKSLPWGKSGRLLLNQELLERKDSISCFRELTTLSL